MSRRFGLALEHFREQISNSEVAEDPSHAQNTMEWVGRLQPGADDILLLAGFAHDVERARSDRYTREMFSSYNDYKLAHAIKSGQIAAAAVIELGYSTDNARRLEGIIAGHEFPSDDPDAQIICDADSISFFDNNIHYYLKDKGETWTGRKMSFMYGKSSDRARSYIIETLVQKPELDFAGLI